MKAKEIRDLNIEDMQVKLNDLKEELFNLRFQHGMEQLENPKMLSKIRKDIARVKTILKESK